MLYQWTVTIPSLTGDEPRRAWAYVPDTALADDARRYPVLYMFDGQNLFRDADATYGKCWGLLDYFTAHNVPVIIAAVECNTHAETEPCGGRLSEYAPWDFSNAHWGDIRGRGAITMDYLIHEFKPYIDEHFPTRPDREHTMIAGSSMGGLMTMYAVLCYNETFSRGAALSPSVAFDPTDAKAMIDNAEPAESVLYIDMGERELRTVEARRLFGEVTARLMAKKLHVVSRIVPDGAHNEATWERQIPFFLNTLLYNLED